LDAVSFIFEIVRTIDWEWTENEWFA